MEGVGLHVRLGTSLCDLFIKAERLKLPFFQTFFSYETTGKYVKKDPYIQTYIEERRDHFSALYLHASYYINLADYRSDAFHLLMRDLMLARYYLFSHVVLHPGALIDTDRERGISSAARTLSRALKIIPHIQILLENTAFGGRSLGSDIEELLLIRERVNYPERVSLCIDTAHAFAFGYSLDDPVVRRHFFNKHGKLARLVHLNDSVELRGSHLDRHAAPGAGVLGEEVLHDLTQVFQGTPLLLELPELDEQSEVAMLARVRSWL